MKLEFLYNIPGTEEKVIVMAEYTYYSGDRITPESASFDVMSITKGGREVSEEAIVRLVQKMYPDEADKFTTSWLHDDIMSKAEQYVEL